MYGLFGKMRAHPGQRESLLAHLGHAARLMGDVDGCHLYIVGSDLAAPDGIWVNEVWRSQEEHRGSLDLAVVKDLIAAARPLIADMPQRFEYAPTGGKGLPEIA